MAAEETGLTTLAPDILTEVLSQLTPKTLHRCEGVCRSLWAFLCSHRFVSAYRAHSPPRPLFACLHEGTLSYPSSPDAAFSHRLPSLCGSPHTLVLGPVRGFLCLCYPFVDGLLLWNPATGDSSPGLVDTALRHPPHALLVSVWCAVGFGYDPRADDFKLVRMANFANWHAAEVYSVRAGSWRELKEPDLDWRIVRALMYPKMSEYHDGACYWIGVDTIACFDMAREAFRAIRPPPYGSNLVVPPRLCSEAHESGSPKITSVVSGTPEIEIDWQTVVVWVMKAEEEGAWTKVISFAVYDHRAFPLTAIFDNASVHNLSGNSTFTRLDS